MYEPTEYPLLRSRASQAAENAASEILYGIARDIVGESAAHMSGKRLTDRAGLLSAAVRIASRKTEDLDRVISRYALMAPERYGAGRDAVEAYLGSRVAGKTPHERNAEYLGRFASDIVRMIEACSLLGYGRSETESAVRTGYRNPYVLSVVTKANGKGGSITVPSYGRGVYRSSYMSIVRNVRETVSAAWSEAVMEYGRESGAVGYRVLRGSSYPCAVCDDLTVGIHPMDESLVPAHTSCRCYVVFVYGE